MGRGKKPKMPSGRATTTQWEDYERRMRQWEGGNSSWSEPMSGADSSGNPLTVSFGEGGRAGETFLGDGTDNPVTFHQSENHNHYGSGSGPNNNTKDRGRYSGNDA